jgi:small subunit ribosomal protein S3
MEEKMFVGVRKDEYNIREFIKRTFGKGRISSVRIEYTPVGEKIVIATHKPGLVIGKKGEKIMQLTEVLKRKFKMENPHIDIAEITHPEFDAQLVADEIALTLERFGALKYKATAYRQLGRIKNSGALGAELRLSGKLPSDRARTWRFAFGYLKKTGDAAKVVDRAQAVAQTKQGVVGIKVAILAPDVKVHDQITVDAAMIEEIEKNANFSVAEEMIEDKKKTKKKKTTKKKVVKKVDAKKVNPEVVAKEEKSAPKGVPPAQKASAEADKVGKDKTEDKETKEDAK